MNKEIKDRIAKRKIGYIYLLHRMFEGNPAKMLKIMHFKDISLADLEEWDKEYREAVYATIREEDAKGVDIKDPHDEVPSIAGIKEKILRQIEAIIEGTTDPARLATAYKVLSEFQGQDEKKGVSVLDAIQEAAKPLSPRKKGAKTMVDKMKDDGFTPLIPKQDKQENE